MSIAKLLCYQRQRLKFRLKGDSPGCLMKWKELNDRNRKSISTRVLLGPSQDPAISMGWLLPFSKFESSRSLSCPDESPRSWCDLKLHSWVHQFWPRAVKQDLLSSECTWLGVGVPGGSSSPCSKHCQRIEAYQQKSKGSKAGSHCRSLCGGPHFDENQLALC